MTLMLEALIPPALYTTVSHWHPYSALTPPVAQAHRAQHIIYDIVGVDVGFDNPIFAVIEMDYTEADEPTGCSPPSSHAWHLSEPLCCRIDLRTMCLTEYLAAHEMLLCCRTALSCVLRVWVS